MSSIEWTGRTWNPIVGCRRVSKGCEHCYAEEQARRQVEMQRSHGRLSVYEQVVKMTHEGKPRARWNGKAIPVPERLAQPLRWRKPTKVFVNSMSDLFHESVPFEYIAAVFGVMAAAPRHTFQVLTKRPERARAFFEWMDAKPAKAWDWAALGCAKQVHEALRQAVAAGVEEQRLMLSDYRIVPWPLPNVWLGASVEDQPSHNARAWHLARCPAAVRFLSVEPLLSDIDLQLPIQHEIEAGTFDTWRYDPQWSDYFQWVIVGGESGHDARPCDLAWIRSIVEQCKEAGTACFVKQLGAHVVSADRQAASGEYLWRASLKSKKGGDTSEWPEDLRVRKYPEARHG